MHGTPYRISLVGIPKHVVTTISAFNFIMLLLDRILTHIVNHLSNTSYHLQYLYCPGGYVVKTQLDNMRCGNFFEWRIRRQPFVSSRNRKWLGRIKARKIFSSKYIQFQLNCKRHMWHSGRVSETHPEDCKFEPRHDLFSNTVFVSCGIRLTTQIVWLLSHWLWR
jgi:hypothetical protein